MGTRGPSFLASWASSRLASSPLAYLSTIVAGPAVLPAAYSRLKMAASPVTPTAAKYAAAEKLPSGHPSSRYLSV